MDRPGVEGTKVPGSDPEGQHLSARTTPRAPSGDVVPYRASPGRAEGGRTVARRGVMFLLGVVLAAFAAGVTLAGTALLARSPMRGHLGRL